MSLIMEEGNLAIRRMRDESDDYLRVARWRNLPHVREWWDPDEPPMTLGSATEEYRPDTKEGAPTTACIIEEEGAPIGYVQFYPWWAYPEDTLAMVVEPPGKDAWALDLFIGEPSRIGHGVGPRVVDLLSRYLFSERGASSVAIVAAKANARALRAYEKAGFRKVESVLDTDTKDGRRVESWLMIRDPPDITDAGPCPGGR